LIWSRPAVILGIQARKCDRNYEDILITPPTVTCELREISTAFDVPGAFREARPHGRGHIHASYRVRFDEGARSHRYLLQRINHQVFPDVPRLMANIGRVTAHVAGRLAAAPGPPGGVRTLTVIPARDGRAYLERPDGTFWRAYGFLDGTKSVETARTAAVAGAAARGFGRFFRVLADLTPASLHEVIPGFHDTPRRLADFERVLARDPAGRADGAAPEIGFVRARAGLARLALEEAAAGALPARVTHNDTKVNNVLLDAATGQEAAVIDLDTVMPGLFPFDFGDQVRTAAFSTPEDAWDPARVRFRPKLFEALVRGWLDTAGDCLTPGEIASMGWAGLLITFEIGLRFLTDHLAGDTYFRIHRPGHTLDRARGQFTRRRALEAAAVRSERIVARCREEQR